MTFGKKSSANAVGAAPGTLAPAPDAPRPKLHVMSYSAGSLEEREVINLDELLLGDDEKLHWINVEGTGDASLFQKLGDMFRLHPLALEDAVNLEQRTKAEGYDDHMYVVMHMPRGRERLELEQVSIFIGERFVITVQERQGDCFEPVRKRVRIPESRLRKSGSDYLAYALIDAIIDSFFPIVEGLDDQLEHHESLVLTSPDESIIGNLHAIRSELHMLRREFSASREAVGLLTRGRLGNIAESTMFFIRDCYDHLQRLLDMTDSCRELSASLMDLYLSSASHRTNEVMMFLTLIATIFIPLSFITGLYGMNFDTERSPWNLPELNWYLGYPFALALMAITSLAFLVYFKRRGWIGTRRRYIPERPTQSG